MEREEVVGRHKERREKKVAESIAGDANERMNEKRVNEVV